MKKAFLFLVLPLCLLLALAAGRYTISLDNILLDLQKWWAGTLPAGALSVDSQVLLLRIPRAIMALLVGASLSASGMVYQCLFRNPLVSPDILGISAGACLGAALAILSSWRHPFIIQGIAFIFGILAVFLTYRLATWSKGHTVIMLVMAGIVVSSFFGSLLSLLKYVADPYQELPTIVFWIMGGLHQIRASDVSLALPLVGIGLLSLYGLRRTLNLLSLGDEEAKALGLNVPLLRLCFITASTVVVGATISMTGIIGWVGLVIPHISRILIKTDHSVALPWSMALGGAFMLFMDTLARSLTPQEIPLGIITALIGAPFFAYLLLFKQEKGWGRW